MTHLRHTATRPYIVAPLITVAVALCGLVIWTNIRLAPINQHIDKGSEYTQKGDSVAAEKEWLEAVRLDPQNVEALQLLGDLYERKGLYKNAMGFYARALAAEPKTVGLQGKMAKTAIELGDAEPAKSFAANELELNPNDMLALQVLAKVESDAGNSPQAIKYLRRLVKLQPKSVDALDNLANELQSRDAYDQVLPVAADIIKLAPDKADGYARQGVALYISNLDADSPTRAKESLLKALSVDPGNIEAHRYLGRTYMRLNQPREAIAQFQAVGRGRPYASAHLMELSLAYRRAGNTRLADATRDRFTYLKGLNTEWINTRDLIKRAPNLPEPYLQAGESILKNCFGSDEGPYNLYRYHFARAELHGVGFYLDKALQMRPQDPKMQKAHAQLELIYSRYLASAQADIKSQQYEKARDAAERVVMLRPDDKRSLALVRQILGAGLNPIPTPPPDTGPYKR